MKIRLAQSKDYAAIARLHRATIRHVNSKDYSEDVISVWSARTKASRFRDSAPKLKRWVAVEKEKIIGFCDHDFKDELCGLYVHKDFQGKGVGKELLKIAEESMRKLGCKKIKLMSTVSAKTFYQKNGYKIIKKDLHPIFGSQGEVNVKVFRMSKTIE